MWSQGFGLQSWRTKTAVIISSVQAWGEGVQGFLSEKLTGMEDEGNKLICLFAITTIYY